jgi:hypothetical protein
MRQWIASALFLTIWLGLVGFITWFDWLNGFLLITLRTMHDRIDRTRTCIRRQLCR